MCQQKKALIVAVGNYPDSSGISAISSLNDIPLIENALVKLGFKIEDIAVLKDEKATKTGIIDAMEKYLVQDVSKGDIAYFHFSGHGQQVQDYNHDESDGYDEALVPYDAQKKYIEGKYIGQKHLIDDTLGIIYNDILTKLGPKGHLLVTIDACHSGTSTRGIGMARGIDTPIASNSYIEKAESLDFDLDSPEIDEKDSYKKASMVAFFGSMANQKNYEITAPDQKQYGSLSYAFSKAVSTLTPNASYQQLFDKIRQIIGSEINNQTPESSGELSQAVLGGKYEGIPEYFILKQWVDKKNVVIEGGYLNGINVGTVVGFFPPETRDKNSKPFATGRVSKAFFNFSIVELANEITETDAVNSWIMVTEQNFGNLAIKLNIDVSENSIRQDSLNNIFKILPFVYSDKADPDLIMSENENKILLKNKFGITIDTFSKTLSRNDKIENIKKSIVRFGQSQFIKKLEMENDELLLSFELKLKGSKNKSKHDQNLISDNNSNQVFYKSDTVQIVVTNNGTRDAYFNLLDFQPDDKLNILYPLKNESSSVLIKPGVSFTIPAKFEINPPYGQEIFKIIASQNPINLKRLSAARGIENKPLDPFEKLFYDTSAEKLTETRGITSNLPPGMINIYSKQFLIKEK